MVLKMCFIYIFIYFLSNLNQKPFFFFFFELLCDIKTYELFVLFDFTCLELIILYSSKNMLYQSQ